MSDINVVSANGWHIADNPALYEPSRTNNFEFVITGVDGILRAGVSQDEAESDDFIANAQETVRLAVNKVTVPNFSQSEIFVSRGNVKSYYAGPIEYNSGSLDVVDYIGKSGKSVLLAWQRLSGDTTTGIVGRAKDYKKDCYLIEYSPDYEKIRSWRLTGCWITAISEPEFNMESADKRVVTATIRYDRALLEKE